MELDDVRYTGKGMNAPKALAPFAHLIVQQKEMT